MGISAGGLTRTQAWIVLALSIVAFGIHWPIMKIGLRAIGPEWFAVLRLAGAAVLYAAALAAGRRLTWPTRRDLPMVVSLGIFQMALMIGLITFGVASVGAGRSAILAYTTPLWVIPGAILLLGERLDKWQIGGLAGGMLGIAILFNPLDFDWADRKVLVGNASVLLAALASAAAMLHIRGHKWDSDPSCSEPDPNHSTSHCCLSLPSPSPQAPLPRERVRAWAQTGQRAGRTSGMCFGCNE
jgi:drug/metabolite transporter (DMT)-like permease